MMKNLLAGKTGVAKRMALLLWAILLAPLAAVAEDNTITVFASGSSTNLLGPLIIGNTGINNVLIISNATKVANVLGIVGNQLGANSNSALVTGTGSIWTNRDTAAPSHFNIGNTGSFNQVVITNGARLVSGLNDAAFSILGRATNSTGNIVIITGSNTSWSMFGDLRLGPGSSNQVIIADGALVSNTGNAIIGDAVFPNAGVVIAGGNKVIVTGSNSTWNAGNAATDLFWLGRLSGQNQLIITNGGRVNNFSVTISVIGDLASTNLALISGVGSQWNINGAVTVQRLANQIRIENGGVMTVNSNLLLGVASTANNNQIAINGGSLIVTNAGGSATVNIVRGTNLLSSGTMTVDRLLVTNGANSRFVFNGGTLNTRGTTVSNTALFVVGNGSSAATLNLLGGTHSFFNGLRITNNARLEGSGTVQAATTVLGTLAPGGTNAGLLQIQGNLTLASNSVFEVDLDGTTPGTQYDQVDVIGTVNLSNSILSLDVGFSPMTNDFFTIIVNDGTDAIQGRFLGRPQESEFVAAGEEFKINYFGGTGNDVVLIVVPEPSSSALLAIGGLLLFWRRKRSAE